MKNAIKFFYNLDVDSIRQVNDRYYLNISDYIYCLEKVIDLNNVNEKIELSNNNLNLHSIIKNISGEYITNINNEYFVLMYIKTYNRNITLDDICNPKMLYMSSNNYSPIKKSIDLWCNKLDYIEYQMSQIEKRYPLLKKSFSYFDGLTENAIQLLKTIENEVVYSYITHYRININESLNEFNNPLHVVIDSRVRDFSEYFKSAYFSGIDMYDDFNKYILYLSDTEKIYLFARLLYPSLYFDLYDNIIDGKEKENIVSELVEKYIKYEQLLKKVYAKLRSECNIAKIEWLI